MLFDILAYDSFISLLDEILSEATSSSEDVSSLESINSISTISLSGSEDSVESSDNQQIELCPIS